MQQIVSQNHGERAVAHQFLGAQHRVTQTERFGLTHIEAIDIGRLDAAHEVEQLLFVARFEFRFDLVGLVEMIFDSALAAARHEDHFGDAGGNRFFNGVLDQRLVNDRQHFLGTCFGSRQKSCPEARYGKHGFGDFQHGRHSHIG